MLRFRCHACGTELTLERVGFRELCPHCDAELHVCLQCRFYAPGHANDCLEPNAEPVRDKDRRNLCEWFQPGDGSGGGGGGVGKEDAEALLRKLLGGGG